MQRRTAWENIGAGISTLAATAALFAALVAPRAAHAVDGSVWADLAKVGKLEANFEQTQTRAVLKQPLVSRGVVRYDRGTASLLWQVVSPGASTFSLVGTIAKMEYPDLGMKDTFDLAQVPEASRLASSLLVWMQADAAAVSRDFDTTYGTDSATLRPKDPTLRGLLSELQIRFASAPTRVRSVDLVEPDADRVHIAFRGVRLDGVATTDP